MKKLIIAAVLSSVLLVNSAFANKKDNAKDVSYQVENSFRQQFGGATEVSWQKTTNYYKAVFKINSESVSAYFSPDGELIGMVHNILSNQLPINLQASLKKNYEDYWITDLFEFAKTDGTGYFITVENADQILILNSNDNANWTVYSKSKKQ